MLSLWLKSPTEAENRREEPDQANSGKLSGAILSHTIIGKHA